jgi:hypothetical protein
MSKRPETGPKAIWREGLDALAFRPDGHDGWCLVHRRAIGTMIGREADATACLAWYAAQVDLFVRAAAAKVNRAGLRPEANFHLTSRDLRRATMSPVERKTPLPSLTGSDPNR